MCMLHDNACCGPLFLWYIQAGVRVFVRAAKGIQSAFFTLKVGHLCPGCAVTNMLVATAELSLSKYAVSTSAEAEASHSI